MTVLETHPRKKHTSRYQLELEPTHTSVYFRLVSPRNGPQLRDKEIRDREIRYQQFCPSGVPQRTCISFHSCPEQIPLSSCEGELP